MTLTALSQQAHTDAVVAALEGAGLVVGRGVRNTEPDGSGDPLDPPCAVVHPLIGGRRYGVLDDWTRHADLDYQVTCVGATQEACEIVRDQVEEVMLAGITVAGRLIDVVRITFGSDGTRRDDDIGAPDLYFIATPRYRLVSTPA